MRTEWGTIQNQGARELPVKFCVSGGQGGGITNCNPHPTGFFLTGRRPGSAGAAPKLQSLGYTRATPNLQSNLNILSFWLLSFIYMQRKGYI